MIPGGSPYSRSDVLAKYSPVPAEPGYYGWYFRSTPPHVSGNGCVTLGDLTLLYVGISPSKPPKDGKASRQNLRKRIRNHYRGDASRSTLRMTLGCLLADELGIGLKETGADNRLIFGRGEAVLSEWMAENAFVAWEVHPEPWVMEEKLISEYSLPLNLKGNEDHPFHAELTRIRAEVRRRVNP